MRREVAGLWGSSHEHAWEGSRGLAMAASFRHLSAGLEKRELVCLRTGENSLRRRDFRSTTCL